MAVGTGDRAPDFDLEEAFDEPRLRLQDFLGKRNVLLVFHPFAFTPVCSEEALDLQADLQAFENADTEVIFVSCDTSAARQAWKEELGATYPFERQIVGLGQVNIDVVDGYGLRHPSSSLPQQTH